jgi:hypothetical protein
MTDIKWPEMYELEWRKNEVDAKHGPSTSRRNEPRVMVRFDCSSSNGCSIPGGVYAKPGTNFMLVYRGELPALRAAFPTPEERADMTRAQSDYERLVDARVVKLTRLTSGPEYDAKRREAMDTIGANPYGIFHRLRNVDPDRSAVRDYPAIDNLVVRELNGVPMEFAPPETPQSVQAAQVDAQTSSLVAALREVFGPLVDTFLAGKGAAPKQAR